MNELTCMRFSCQHGIILSFLDLIIISCSIIFKLNMTPIKKKKNYDLDILLNLLKALYFLSKFFILLHNSLFGLCVKVVCVIIFIKGTEHCSGCVFIQRC